MPKPYTVGSLFAGIGGIDLGLERTGYFRTAWVCERDAYCQRVLAQHWPDVPVYDDVADIGEDTPAVDVIAAGFPCQPVSHAGRRKAQDDERWLWPHVERCIRVLRPSGVVLENVAGLFTAGFDDVIGGLAACGYNAEWDCIPAAAVGAPHRRDRVFVVAARPDVANVSTTGEWCPTPMAYAAGAGLEGANRKSGLEQRAGCGAGREQQAMADATRVWGNGVHDNARELARPETARQSRNGAGETLMANASGIRRQGQGQPVHTGYPATHPARETGEPEHGGEPREWPPEPNVGRVADGVPRRVDRLRALGNAVVPQVAEYVGHQLFRVMGGADAFTQREAD